MIKKDNIEELYELVIQDDTDGLFAVSLVESPAIERDFIYMSKELQFAQVSEEKRLVAGPLLVPMKKILRLKENGEPYYVYFTEKGIEDMARKFMKEKLGDQVTLEHNGKTSGVYLSELWIVEASKTDKSNLYGFTLPKGTLFGIYKIENDDVWQKVKDGTFRGFSIEALLEHKKSDVKLALEKNIEDLTDDEAEVLLGQIKAIIRKDKRYKSKQWIEMETFADYGSGVRSNAKKGIELNEKNGNKCATQTGKVRAQQLANGEAVSVQTIRRMYSYLSRAETYYDNADSTSDCGYISYLLWGGKAALGWSRNKLRELGLLEENAEGVPHYTKDGKLWTGPTHKDASGRLMTGATHTEDSEYLYHKEELEAQPSIPNSTYPGEAAKKRKKDDK
jgi:hypothetical protein